MKRPEKEEAMRWFTHAKDEFNTYSIPSNFIIKFAIE